MSDATDRRIAHLESVLRSLVHEVEELRAEVARLRGDRPASAPRPSVPPRPAAPPASAPPPPPPPPRVPREAPWSRPSIDVEALVGRYGTMALGGLAVLLGVGAFLGWAVQRVTLGPTARVVLGALVAALVAALGFWLRGRNARRFGNVLLALALAIVHVVAWGAGPALGVVPPWVALAGAAAASAALATLAWREGEEALFAVGTGGALLAPFVTADAEGSAAVLLAYGWVVIAAAIAALRDREWRLAARLLVLGAAGYVATTIGPLGRAEAWLRQDLPAVFALACAVTALALAGATRRDGLARGFLVVLLLTVAGIAVDPASASRWDLVALAALGSATLAAALADAPWTSGAQVSAALIPLGFLAAALLALVDQTSWSGAGVAALWALMAAGAARVAPLERRDPALLVAGLSGAIADMLGLEQRRLLAAPALAAYGAAAAALARRLGAGVLLPGSALAVFAGGTWALDLLDARTAYAYTPFLTSASVAAALTVAGAWVAGREAAAMLRGGETPGFAVIGQALGPVALFLWGREELRFAGSPDLAAFLLIAYYAAVGVGLIGLGRRRASVVLRRVGLALAVYAALKAIAQASDFAGIGLRVAAYLLVGAFLLGVAYWYRARGEGENGAAVATTPAADDAARSERPA